MKKTILACSALLVLAATSCKKKESDPAPSAPTPEAPKSYWKLDDKTYNSVVGSKLNDVDGLYFLRGADSNVMFPDNSCNFYFSTYPKAGGTYKIVDDSDIPAADEMFIVVYKDWRSYYSNNGGTAAVTVKDNKVTVSISSLKLYSAGNTDTVNFSCNIIQTK